MPQCLIILELDAPSGYCATLLSWFRTVVSALDFGGLNPGMIAKLFLLVMLLTSDSVLRFDVSYSMLEIFFTIIIPKPPNFTGSDNRSCSKSLHDQP